MMINTLLTRVPPDQLGDWRGAYDTLQGLTGDATFVEVFAQAPELLQFVMGQFYMPLFFGGRVEQRYKQLARLKLSLEHGCHTCNKQNVPGALAAGITQAQVDAMDAYETGPFTEAEKAVIAYADQVKMTNHQGHMTPELLARLRAHFSEPEILELGVVMAVISGMAKLSFVLELVEREPTCPFNPDVAA
jgi:alkylhydroperoxidase family enzyme